jgi:Zn-dependent protease
MGLISELFTSPLSALIFIASIVVAITVHEFSHAKMADILGDPTPRLQDRLTLNPRAHLDLWGSIFFLFTGFGWGKAVVFDPYNLKDPRRDAMKIALAGPVSNLIMALIASLIAKMLFLVPSGASELLIVILQGFIHLNVVLAVFNLLPVEPLDGFKVIGGLLSREQAIKWYSLRQYGPMFLFLLIIPFGPGPSIVSTYVNAVSSFILRFLV